MALSQQPLKSIRCRVDKKNAGTFDIIKSELLTTTIYEFIKKSCDNHNFHLKKYIKV